MAQEGRYAGTEPRAALARPHHYVSFQDGSAGRRAYSYVLCKSQELQAAYLIVFTRTPRSQRAGHSRFSTRTAVAKVQPALATVIRPTRVASTSVVEQLATSCRLRLACGNVSLRRQTAHAELSPRRTPPLPEQSIAAPNRQDGSAWRIVARQADRIVEKDIEPKRGRRDRRP